MPWANSSPVSPCFWANTAARARGITVCNIPAYSTQRVAHTAVMLLLNLASSMRRQLDMLSRGDRSNFTGHLQCPHAEVNGKTLGVIGLGAIGALVCNIALDLGMDVYGYDPFLSVDAALRLDRHVHVVKNVDELYRVSDYITIHIPYNNSTKDFINAESIAKMKGQVRILNLARGGLVNDDDMIQALESGRVARYVTDFPNGKTANMPGCIAIPHLGASTEESEDNCAVMAADELKDYLENGNIKNSVNYPACDMGICQVAGRIG